MDGILLSLFSAVKGTIFLPHNTYNIGTAIQASTCGLPARSMFYHDYYYAHMRAACVVV